MAVNKMKALLVEDSRSFRKLILSFAPESVEWDAAETHAEANVLIDENDYDIVILDLHLADGNSLDLCGKIRASKNGSYCSVIFISGEEKLEWRLRAYEAGADDFVSKRIVAEELMVVFDALVNYQLRKNKLRTQGEEQVRYISQTMFENMEDANVHLSFCRDCLKIHTMPQLDDLICKFITSLELQFVMLIKSNNEQFLIKSNDMDLSPIEENLFSELSDNGHHVQSFGHKTYFCYGDVQMIVKNMPIENDGLYGRLKDSLHIIISVIDDKNHQLKLLNEINNICGTAISLAPEGQSELLDNLCSIQTLLKGEEEFKAPPSTDDVTFF